MRDRTTSVKPSGTLDNVLFVTWLVSRANEDLIDTVLRPSGLTGDEFAIYSVLLSQGTMTPSELSRWMAAPPTSVSSYVKRLEARGHVERVSNPDDGRSYRLQLTTAGRKAHRAAGARFLPVLADVTEALGRDRPAVEAALAALNDALGEVRAARGVG